MLLLALEAKDHSRVMCRVDERTCVLVRMQIAADFVALLTSHRAAGNTRRPAERAYRNGAEQPLAVIAAQRHGAAIFKRYEVCT